MDLLPVLPGRPGARTGRRSVAGILLARRWLLRAAFEPYVIALYAIPMVGIISFLLALLGYAFWPKVVVIFLFAFLPVLLNTPARSAEHPAGTA